MSSPVGGRVGAMQGPEDFKPQREGWCSSRGYYCCTCFDPGTLDPASSFSQCVSRWSDDPPQLVASHAAKPLLFVFTETWRLTALGACCWHCSRPRSVEGSPRGTRQDIQPTVRRKGRNAERHGRVLLQTCTSTFYSAQRQYAPRREASSHRNGRGEERAERRAVGY